PATPATYTLSLHDALPILNTMYSAVAERSREIATLRALGFGSGSIVVSFVAESLCIALVGGVLGCVVVLPLNGLTTGTINWQTLDRKSTRLNSSHDQISYA